MLKINEKAPNFTLKNSKNENISLNDFLGKKVILYFYPKDNTPGCTRQANEYKDLYQDFINKNAVIIGISKDSIESHASFIEKYNLPFILLSDPDLIAIKAYDVWQEKSLYGKKYIGIVRSSFIIDEQGILKEINLKVSPATNAKCMLKNI